MDHTLVSEIEFKTGVRLAPMIALEASIKNAIVEARRALKAGPKKITAQRAARARPARSAACRRRRGRRTAPSPSRSPSRARCSPSTRTRSARSSRPWPAPRLLPVQSPSPTPARAGGVEEVQTILVVDDDESILRLMETDPGTRSATEC